MKNKKIRDMTLISMGAVIIVVCSLITIPATIPFTLQTFGIFFALYNLGGKRGTLSVLLYIALGLCGIPVFANFGVGIGTFIGPTGGYLWGFLLGSGLYWLIEKLFGKKILIKAASLCLVMIIYYGCGMGGYALWSSANGNNISFWAIFTVCVAPYAVFDILKLILVLVPKKSYFEKLDD